MNEEPLRRVVPGKSASSMPDVPDVLDEIVLSLTLRSEQYTLDAAASRLRQLRRLLALMAAAEVYSRGDGPNEESRQQQQKHWLAAEEIGGAWAERAVELRTLTMRSPMEVDLAQLADAARDIAVISGAAVGFPIFVFNRVVNAWGNLHRKRAEVSEDKLRQRRADDERIDASNVVRDALPEVARRDLLARHPRPDTTSAGFILARVRRVELRIGERAPEGDRPA